MTNISKSAIDFIKYSFSETKADYRLFENGNRCMNYTLYGKFYNDKKNAHLFTVISEGNDAPRGGKVGTYHTVAFTEEFMKLVEEVRLPEKLEAERKASVLAQAQQIAKLIEPIKGEAFEATTGRLSAAIGSKIDSLIFYKAVGIVRKSA
jgi:hypothetical protein